MFEKGVSDSSLPTQQSPLGTARSEEEFAAYKELFEPLSPEEVAKKAELFLRDYPNSGLSLFVRQAVVVAYEKLSDDTKLVVHAETLLKEQPHNLVVLTILARAYARMEQYDNAIDRAAAAIEYGKRLERPSQTTKPELRLELTRLTAENLATMGTAHLGKVLSKRDAPNETMIQQAGLHQAVENFHKALALNPSDGLSCYRLAIAYALQEDALNAVKFYARAVALGGPVAHVAEVNLTKVLRVMRRDLKLKSGSENV